jgi:hypothetical protein
MSSSRGYHIAIRRQTNVIFGGYSIVIALSASGVRILVLGDVGGSTGYDRKNSPVRRAFNLEGGFIVSIILPFERNVTVLFDVGGQIGRCGWHDQRHSCGIGIGRVAS